MNATKVTPAQLKALRTIAENRGNVGAYGCGSADMLKINGNTENGLRRSGLARVIQTETVLWHDAHYNVDHMVQYWELTEAGKAAVQG